MSHTLVIVESPAKGKTIEKYLGKDYQVEASFGHIRDLPEKNIGVDISAGFVAAYEVTDSKKKRVAELRKYAKSADHIILATDPDREGEAIAWHLAHVFGIDPAKATRVKYNEITKESILQAFAKPGKIDIDLVNAQQSRRILDRIVGYEVSPVLWRKVGKGLSAGRVQSVATKLVVEREREIQKFIPEESWKIQAYVHAGDMRFPIEFLRIDGKPKKLKDHTDTAKFFSTLGIDIQSVPTSVDKKGNTILSIDMQKKFVVGTVEKKKTTRIPGAPFTTSTLQQEAARKLGYGVKMTMDIAQQLYQEGYITYMRTDSVHLSDTAIGMAKDYIQKEYGNEYVLPKGRTYKNKQANAQEAHEAIRPAYIDKVPGHTGLDTYKEKLYKLIWDRTVASQMAAAEVETTTFTFSPIDRPEQDWIVKGEVILFPGFMKLYIEGTDEEIEEDGNMRLPKLSEGEQVQSERLDGMQKFSLPPARYTEASLVKKLEAEGIGRPSTYAPTIQTIQDRGYIHIESKKLCPTDIAFVVTDFLEKEFGTFMQYTFTADVERQFDDIASGQRDYQDMLGAFYTPFHESIETALGAEGRFAGEKILGTDPATGRTVLVRMSRYGPVVQIGTTAELGEEKPKYANLPMGQTMETATYEEAMKGFALPKDLGVHDGVAYMVGLGRYGPYVKYGEAFVSLPRGEDPLGVDIARAKALIAEKALENAPICMYEGEGVTKGKGRFGPFLKYKSMYINIPKNIDPDSISEDECIRLIDAKIAKEGNRYIQQWADEKISVENGRWGPFIRYGKSNYKLIHGKKKYSVDEAATISLDDVKSCILEQDPTAFGKVAKKPAAKKKAGTVKKVVKKKV